MELDIMIFIGIIAFMWMMYLWETYLDYRQHRVYRDVHVPPSDVDSILDSETFSKSRLYNLEKSGFDFISGFYSMVESMLILYYGALPWLWAKCLEHTVWLGFTREHEITASMIFMVYVSLFTFVDSLPWKAYRAFVIEERHGFNNQTVAFFIKDKIKALSVTLVIALPVSAGLLWIIGWGGPHFYVYAWGFTFAVTIFMMFIYPDFIAPLFDRYELLPEADLKTRIQRMADSISFPLKKIYVVEGSKRSSHSNAYFYGFWKNKRIVLYDTLLADFVFPKSGKTNESTAETDQTESSGNLPEGVADSKEKRKTGCNDEEVLAVLGHELGHWKMNHTNYNLLISEINIFIMFFAFGQLIKLDVFYAAFGFYSANPAPVLLRLIIIFQFIFSPYNSLEEFLSTLLSRRFEFQADAFAVQMLRGVELKSALIKLEKDNLGFPVNDWLYSTYNFSHPPIMERLNAIDVELKRSS